MSSQVLKASTPPTSAPEPSEAVREQIAIQGRLRCPYCHDDCEPSASVACRDCLARHHATCWKEQGTCASCGSTHKLVAETPSVLSEDELAALLHAGKSEEVEAYYRAHGATEDAALRKAADLAFQLLAAAPSETWPLSVRTLFSLQAAILLGCSLIALGNAEVAVVTGGIALCLSFFVTLVLRFRNGRVARGATRSQLALAATGFTLAPLFIEAFNIRPNDSAPLLFLLGCLLSAIAVYFGTGVSPRSAWARATHLLSRAPDPQD